MTLKLLFFCSKITKIAQRQGAPPSTSPYVTHLSYISFSKLGPKLDNFCAKKIYFWFTPLSKILIARLLGFTAADKVFKRLWAAVKTS